jgi:hypothetical protein
MFITSFQVNSMLFKLTLFLLFGLILFACVAMAIVRMINLRQSKNKLLDVLINFMILIPGCFLLGTWVVALNILLPYLLLLM